MRSTKAAHHFTSLSQSITLPLLPFAMLVSYCLPNFRSLQGQCSSTYAVSYWTLSTYGTKLGQR